jgi:hypothetical protein
VALYIYNTPEDVRKFTYTLFDNILNGSSSDGVFDTILNGSIGNWIRVLFPVVVIGLGSALYGRLQMPPLEVNKTPKRVVCDPSNDPALHHPCTQTPLKELQGGEGGLAQPTPSVCAGRIAVIFNKEPATKPCALI